MGWFGKEWKNRRQKTEVVLEVRQRKRQANAARLRLMAGALGFSLFTFFGLFLLWRGGEWVLKVAVYENPTFAIRRIDVQTDGVLSAEQIRKWAGVKLQDNLLALDLARLKRHLELVPVIKEASVERILPDLLKVRVAERMPFAQVRALQPRWDGSGFEIASYYLDEDGYVMVPVRGWTSRAQAGYRIDDLPILTGVRGSELKPGYPAQSEQIQAALRLIAAFERSAMFTQADLVRIDLSTTNLLHVTTGQGSELIFSPQHPELQLERWRQVQEHGARNGKAIASLDLSVMNNLPASWMEASLAPPVKSKPLPSRLTHPARGARRHRQSRRVSSKQFIPTCSTP